MIDATPENRKQVAEQCRAVAHMARAIAGVHDDYKQMFEAGGLDSIMEIVGQRSAYLLEMLGDTLNGMDAVTEDDDWIGPVIRRAQELWPDAAKAT